MISFSRKNVYELWRHVKIVFLDQKNMTREGEVSKKVVFSNKVIVITSTKISFGAQLD